MGSFSHEDFDKNYYIGNGVEGERINYNRRELTEQEMELVQMHNQVLNFVFIFLLALVFVFV